MSTSHNAIEIPFSTIPQNAKMLTPFFEGYNASSELDIIFNVIKTYNKWIFILF